MNNEHEKNFKREEGETRTQPERAGGDCLLDANIKTAGVVEEEQENSGRSSAGNASAGNASSGNASAGSPSPSLSARAEGDGQPGPESEHDDCYEECRRTCKRNFWATFLQAVVKVATIILAGLGLQSFNEE